MAQKHDIDCKEYPMTRDGKIQGPAKRYRRLRNPSFNAALWTEKNPLLQRGEIGVEMDTYKAKVGDGVTYWNDLPYMAGGADGDGITIDLNSNDKAQAIGLINKNEAVGATNPIYDWIGTYAEFTSQNIATLHPDWLCFITDDGGGVGGIYTAAECDARFSTKTETTTALATKANVSADNFNDVGKTLISGLGRFSYRFEQLVPVSGSLYTAPANGYFVADGILVAAAGNRLYMLLRNKQYMYSVRCGHSCFGTLSTYRHYVWVPVKKGDQISVTTESTSPSPDWNLIFYYADGVPTVSPTYTEVEYIEGTYNTQYIKTRVVPASGLKLYCKMQTTGSGGFGWGARNLTYDGANMNVSQYSQSVVVDWFGASAADRWTVSTSVAATDIFELTIENNVAVLAKNGTNIATHTFTPSATITRELYLTGFNNNGTLGNAGATGRLYAFKLWTPDNEPLLDMVPAKDGSGVACLYNRATDTLYYNQGTGSYTAGPEI